MSNVAAARRECDIPLAPPVMQLRYKNLYQILSAPPHHLHPDRRILLMANSGVYERSGSQNPPVLLPPEMVCSARKHPLSSGSGRKRYNTLDFASAKSCANRALSPLLETQNQGDRLPFGNLPVFSECIYTLQKSSLHPTPRKHKIPRSILQQ